MRVAYFLLSVVHSLLLFPGNMEAEDILKHLRALDYSKPSWEEPFGMSKLLPRDLHCNLMGFFDKCQSFFLAVTRVLIFCKRSCNLFPFCGSFFSRASVSSVCYIIMSCALLVRPDWGVPVVV